MTVFENQRCPFGLFSAPKEEGYAPTNSDWRWAPKLNAVERGPWSDAAGNERSARALLAPQQGWKWAAGGGWVGGAWEYSFNFGPEWTAEIATAVGRKVRARPLLHPTARRIKRGHCPSPPLNMARCMVY